MSTATDSEVAQLRADVRVLRDTLGTLIALIATWQSLNQKEARDLSEKLQQVQG